MTSAQIANEFNISKKSIIAYAEKYNSQSFKQLHIELLDRLNVKLLAQELMNERRPCDIYEFFNHEQNAAQFMTSLYSLKKVVADSVYKICLLIINKFDKQGENK
jgi:DNA-binding MurR/RpiR family transcriptional regulator